LAWEAAQEQLKKQNRGGNLPNLDEIDAAYVRAGYKPYKRPDGLLRRLTGKPIPTRAIGRRATRYGLGLEDQGVYDRFVSMVSRMEQATMVDFVEDALKDAGERRALGGGGV